MPCGVQKQQQQHTTTTMTTMSTTTMTTTSMSTRLWCPEAAGGCDLSEVGVEEPPHLRVLYLDHHRLAAI